MFAVLAPVALQVCMVSFYIHSRRPNRHCAHGLSAEAGWSHRASVKERLIVRFFVNIATYGSTSPSPGSVLHFMFALGAMEANLESMSGSAL
eukprot:4649484-Pleurochrysis_carterae.AAC.1